MNMEGRISRELCKCLSGRGLNIFATILALFSFVGSLVCMTVSFVLFCPDCPWSNSVLMWTNVGASICLFLFGLITIWELISRGLREARQNSSMTAQVVVSEIPAEDVEKSPAPMLTYCNVPHHQPFDETSSSIDLPDYFTVVQNRDEVSSGDVPDYFSSVQNIDEVYSSLDMVLGAEDTPRTPPPCYEEAIKMEPWLIIPV